MMNRIARILTGVLAVLALAAPAAWATDGVTLINQTTFVAGLPGCGSLGGVTVVICSSGSYRLSGNLTEATPGANAIEITASNVTLDLNGFTVSGPSGSIGSAIYSFNTANSVNVANGTVTGFRNGVVLNGSGSVRAVVAAENPNAGILLNGLGSVQDCLVYSSAANAFGIVADGPVDQVTGNTVSTTGSGSYAVTLGTNTGYGLNSIFGSVVGGVSQGNNACNGSKC